MHKIFKNLTKNIKKIFKKDFEFGKQELFLMFLFEFYE